MTVADSSRCEESEMNATYSCQMANVDYSSSPLSCLRRTSPLRSEGIGAERLMCGRKRRGEAEEEKDAGAVAGMLAAIDL